jgi:hypothetical protein
MEERKETKLCESGEGDGRHINADRLRRGKYSGQGSSLQCLCMVAMKEWVEIMESKRALTVGSRDQKGLVYTEMTH